MVKLFYRVSNSKTNQGLWYDFEGNFTGLIHEKFNFCKNKDLEMPFCEEIRGYLSATDNLDDLFQWFPVKDIKKLQNYDYTIDVYASVDHKFFKNHWVINQNTSKLCYRITLTENGYSIEKA